MSSESKAPSEEVDTRAQLKSCGSEGKGYSEAIDLLVVWVLEDIEAVANSLGIELRSILKDALERVQSEAPFFARRRLDSEAEARAEGGD